MTDRGLPEGEHGPSADVDLEAAAEAGWLTRATASARKAVPRHKSLRSIQQVLDEDRNGDR